MGGFKTLIRRKGEGGEREKRTFLYLSPFLHSFPFLLAGFNKISGIAR
jgi:hypothetical protein